MRAKGKISSWNEEKGFGFITPFSGGKQVFVHIKSFKNRNRRPEVNQLLTYALSTDKQGRSCAVKVILDGGSSLQKIKSKNGSLSVIVAVIFLSIVAVSVLTDKTPPMILAIYVVASILTFIMYFFDKSAARKGAWRTRESTLHLLSLAGGWPGALIAQQRLHHKTQKKPFRYVFWLTVLLNCGTFIWLFTLTGTAVLDFIDF
ncbi:MAG: DUF1294 domain-containing protein [Candidatus Brocadiaceae bacterium]|nr:DUF1294 domain-containing protein [Candidatus Brocadiaceae bacterium]